jgi:hypothetical protein
MATPSKDDVLTFDVLVDIRASVKAMEKFAREMKKSMKGIAESGQKVSKQTKKAAKAGKDDTDKWRKSVENLNKEYERQDDRLKTQGDSLRDLRKLHDAAAGKKKAGLVVQIDALEKAYKRQVTLGKAARGNKARGGVGKMALTLIAPKGLKAAMADAGEELKAPLAAFLQKDAKNFIEKSADIFGAGIKRAYKPMQLLSRVSRLHLKREGEKKLIAGKAAGGVGGAMTQLGGGSLKMLGSLLSGFGKIMRPLAALAPLLQSSIIGVIQFFLDADATVKDFNRGIMESTSNVEFLNQAGGSASLAIMNMGKALDGVREAALDQSFNSALGITADTHTAILNTLNQEGVAFGNLAKQAGNTEEGMKKLTQSIVTMGVGYSRSLGVPLQEIVSLQAEMAVEMGQSIDSTAESFANITRAAAGSGIAGIKFFNIIKGSSADLSLWNLRLDGAVDLLSKLGKIMNPRSAASFFQTIASGFKNMSRQDLLRQTLMVGPKWMRKEMVSEIAEQRQEVAKQISEAGSPLKIDDIVALIKEHGYRGADEAIRGITDKSKMGTLRHKAAGLQTLTQGSEGDEYSVSQGSREIQSIPRQMETMARVAESLGGSLLNVTKVNIGAVAEASGQSQELVEQLRDFALAVDSERHRRTELTKKNAQGTFKTPEAIAAEVSRIQGLSAQQITDEDPSLQADAEALKKSQEDAAQSVQDAVKEMSKKQGQLTQSFIDKFDNFVKWFTNKLYNLMKGIFEAVMDLADRFGSGTAGKKRAVYKSGSSELIQAFEKALDKNSGTADFGKVKGSMAGGAFGKKLDALVNTDAGKTQVASSVGKNFSGKEVLDMASNMGLDQERKAKLQDRLQRTRTSLMPTDGGAGGMIMTHQATSGLAQTGEVGDILAILKDIGLSSEEQADLLRKAGWASGSLESLSGLAHDIDSGDYEVGAGGGVAPTLATSPTAPTAVAASAGEHANEQLDTVIEDNKKTETTLKQQGVKIAPATLKAEAKGMEASMLSALRTALFEYYMYSDTDRGTMIAAMKAGKVAPGQVGPKFLEGALAEGGPSGGVNNVATPPPEVLGAKARGGMVTGIARGLAVVAAQGEGLASVGRGERIMPAGGGSAAGINVMVNGIGGPDLVRLIEGKVIEGVREYRRREKFN